MNDQLDLETILKKAPRPQPPVDLLATLERQIQMPASAQPRPTRGRSTPWWRWWLPLGGLATAALVAFVTVFLSSSTPTMADSWKVLARLKSCHVIERFRDGPGRYVIHDQSQAPTTYPNYVTSYHPENPLVTSEYWFKVDANDLARPWLRTMTPDGDVWRHGNQVLTVDRKTGTRSFNLENGPGDILATLGPLAGLSGLPLPASPASTKTGGIDKSTGLWQGESRISLPGESDTIVRVWVNSSNNLPAKIQFWSTDFPQIAPEVLMREYLFSDFDAAFPQTNFAFAVTDGDAASVGLTRLALDTLSPEAFVFRVTGEAGCPVSGTIHDDAGDLKIAGIIPFALVHEQRGKMSFDLFMNDHQRHPFGVQFNSMNSWMETSHLKGTKSAHGNQSAAWDASH